MYRAPLQAPTYSEVAISYANEDQTVAIVSFNRPEKRNALTFDMFYMIRECFEYLDRVDSPVRAIILTGAGVHFTAGIDLMAVPKDL